MDGGFARASLTEILEVERDCCARLGELIEGERRAIAGRNLAGLLAAVKEREVVQALWQRALAARALRLGPEEGAAALRARDPAAARLLLEVRTAATELARAQRSNAAIIRGALGQVCDLLATLRRAQPGSRYDGHAALTAPLPHAAGGGWSA
jgi:hypothetical protein